MRQHTNVTKVFDYTAIADKLRTVSLGNDSRQTGVVKPVYGIPTSKPINLKADLDCGKFQKVEITEFCPSSLMILMLT